jgi:3-oxoacyl-[acyl-carrier protein] reductase
MGRATALAFAREGARVVAVDVDAAGAEAVAAEIVAGGGQSLSVGADVRRGADVRAAVDRAVASFGAVDVLACIAGVLRRSKIEAIDEDEWDLVLDVNLKGVFLCCQAVLPMMKARRSGKIVVLASMAGRATSTFGGAHYTASKAGVLGLCRHVAREAAPFGINVNAINPGVIDTPMVQSRSTPEEIARITAGVPFGRFGTADEVADLVVFLASDQSAYITGAAVDIHGGEMFI